MDKPLNLKVAIVGLGYHPHVPIIRPTREHPHWAGARSVAGDRATVAGFDVVVIATAPAGVNYREVADWVPRIVETRNAMAAVQVAPGKVWKA